jgi:acyl dehydratase
LKFRDFSPGQLIHAGPYSVNESEVIEFAQAYDPQWFHTQPAAAAKGRFQGLIASGWHTCSIAMRLIAEVALQGSESYASPGIAYIKWPVPVRPGDTLSLTAEVLGVRISKKNQSLGILTWRWQLLNQHGQQVLELEATSLFDLSQQSQPSAA